MPAMCQAQGSQQFHFTGKETWGGRERVLSKVAQPGSSMVQSPWPLQNAHNFQFKWKDNMSKARGWNKNH